ncbi:hypothetical protein KBJ12_06695, partial [Campylobacter jejuni]|nr:hypothetical protein [Campylobacter jejuni]MCG4165925.1 hypothetical protein [Campylobacter jejuni]
IAYSALFTGVILSFITAFGVSWLFKENAGQSRELIEGIIMLIAVLLLFYVGFGILFLCFLIFPFFDVLKA